MKKTLTIILTLAVVGAVGFAVWKFFGKKGGKRWDSPQVVTAMQGSIQDTVDATGGVAPLNRVEIKPPISGRIERLLVDEGTRVKSGQTLAWMSSSDRAAILDAARAQ